MKSLSKIIGVFAALLLTVPAFAQPHPILDDFNGFRDGNAIQLRWTVSSGSTCNGIQIYRATDTTSFYQVGDIQGICGSSSGATAYSFTDANPIPNQVNYYRLELGTQGYSVFIAIDFTPIGPGGYQIRPNPVSDYTTIYFDNPANAFHSLLLFDQGGGVARTIENVSGDKFYVDLSDLKAGVYFFVIMSEGKERIHGRIVRL